MALQLSVGARNAQLDAIETACGTDAKLRIFTGSVPADCAQADPAGQLVEITLPSNWMADAGSGQKAMAGSWSGTAGGAGTAASFRIKDSAGTTCHIQGTVGQGSGDLSLDNAVIANNQTVNVTGFTLTAGNA